MVSCLLSSSEKQYILDGCRDNCRMDGRTCDEFRFYTVVVGSNTGSSTELQQSPPPVMLSNGSSRLFLAAGGCTSLTHIICSVKAELVHPSLEHSTEGQLQIHVDYAGGGSGIGHSQSNQGDHPDHVQSILNKLLQTNVLDLKALCIVPHHYVWNLQIDVLILAGLGGNLIDACSYAIRSALQQTLLPQITTNFKDNNNNHTVETKSANADLIVNSDIHYAQVPPGTEYAPTIITITILKDDSDTHNNTSGWHLLVDATLEEQTCSYCQVHVAVQPQKLQQKKKNSNNPTKENMICALTTSGKGSIPMDLLKDITSLALESSKRQQQRYVISGAGTSSGGLLQEQFAIQ